ncbi:PREDICTED: spore wall protein 2-like [Habropoda laboriosa]|uniref:spore wall protein 2-like n=1 Tax=Habropoda laboriosa TaxID=597456 RepID=UPI00083D5E27|nr:PREDICTED: spore wall protein 2-like [Habropoda laboriosa]
MWRGPLLLLLLVYCGSLKARGSHGDVVSDESARRDARHPAPFATEVEDLLGEGNTPEKKESSKKSGKNSAGKSDEGGYYKTYGSDAEGEKGYLKATYSKGNHGYKTLDTFHKQDGDKYAFEKRVAYGKARADKKSSHNDEAASRFRKADDHEGAGTMVDTRYATDEGDNQNNGGEHVEATDHESYTHEDSGHYTDHGPESSSYGHGESYADGDGEHGSYESHSSYSTSSGGEHGDEGGHYY